MTSCLLRTWCSGGEGRANFTSKMIRICKWGVAQGRDFEANIGVCSCEVNLCAVFIPLKPLSILHVTDGVLFYIMNVYV